MRIAKVIGNLTLNRSVPEFAGARLRVVVPFALDDLTGSQEPSGEPLIAWDELGAGDGSLIGLSEGPEASQPFRPDLKPVDAYVAAILDEVELVDLRSSS